MSLQILRLSLYGITAGDYLTWCRDPEPPALDYALRSIRVDADPLSDTITAVLDWNQPAPAPATAAAAAGLPLPPGVQIHARPASDAPQPNDDQRFARRREREDRELVASATLGRCAPHSRTFRPAA